MIWFLTMQIISILLDWVRLGKQSAQEKDLEILLLRHQLAIYERKHPTGVRLSRGEKLILVMLASRLRTQTSRTLKALREVIRIVQPETIFKWHRALVRRKWTQRRVSRGGRPRTDAGVEVLVVRLARENDWGNGKIAGELLKLGHDISDETVASILKRHGIPPVPERNPSLSWQQLMNYYKDQLLSCDFFTVETLFLQTIYVLFFIEIGSRRVHFAGCTSQPTGQWVTQQARQMTWEFESVKSTINFLLHDRDSKFSTAFDTVFRSEGMKIILTPVRAPNANAYAERWVRTVREECLDKLIILNETHLRRVMREFVDYYNTARPHQGIDQQIPISQTTLEHQGAVRCRPILGGIIRDYYRDAA